MAPDNFENLGLVFKDLCTTPLNNASTTRLTRTSATLPYHTISSNVSQSNTDLQLVIRNLMAPDNFENLGLVFKDGEGKGQTHPAP
jgi:hypothetical protein